MLVAIFVWILALAQFDDISNLGPTYKGDDRLAQWHLHLGEKLFMRATTELSNTRY